ncbi:MAG TPA: hypothetical protein VJO35_14340 [Terriglobales bacterium]|nr:hypothetical protein [Terriglobales bacterium]
MPSLNLSHSGPHWYFVPIRVLLVTFIFTLLSFAVSLLVGIVIVLTAGKIHGTPPDFRLAYRFIAFPAALTVAVTALVSATVVELRHYRRSRTLSHIERQMGRAS